MCNRLVHSNVLNIPVLNLGNTTQGDRGRGGRTHIHTHPPFSLVAQALRLALSFSAAFPPTINTTYLFRWTRSNLVSFFIKLSHFVVQASDSCGTLNRLPTIFRTFQPSNFSSTRSQNYDFYIVGQMIWVC